MTTASVSTKQSEIEIQSPHHYWIDLVRIVAVFQIILVHLSYVIFFKYDLLSPNWIAANIYDSFSRMGVPLFFMVSGYLLIGKSEPNLIFFRKRLVKVGIPTLFWSFFYLFWRVDAYSSGNMSPLAVALSILKTIYLGDVEIHLWFLYILIGIYLVVPILRVYVSTASRRDLTYFTLMWFVATSIFEVVQRITGYKSALVIPVVTGYVGYFVMGYWLASVKLSRRGRIISLIGIVAAVVLIIFGTNFLSANAGSADFYFYSYFSPATVLASICGYLLLKDLGQNLGGAGKMIRAVSTTSFGIYLIHIFVIGLLRKGTFGFRIYSWMGPSVYMIPFTALAVFIISFFIVFTLRKIPFLKILVP